MHSLLIPYPKEKYSKFLPLSIIFIVGIFLQISSVILRKFPFISNLLSSLFSLTLLNFIKRFHCISTYRWKRGWKLQSLCSIAICITKNWEYNTPEQREPGLRATDNLCCRLQYVVGPFYCLEVFFISSPWYRTTILSKEGNIFPAYCGSQVLKS